MNTSVVSVSSSLEESDDDDAMPTLSPQSSFTVHSSPLEASDSELHLPGLTKYSSSTSALQEEGSSTNKDLGQTVTNESARILDSTVFSVPRCPRSLDGNITSMSEQCQKLAPKRALDFFENTENHRSNKRLCVENSTSPRCHAERLIELEDILHERKLQEEQDRLVALKLQKLLDREVTQVSRQKGSPDEYKLRPQTSAPQQNSSESSKRTACKPSTEQSISKSSESGESSDENKKPASKKQDKSLLSSERSMKSTGQPTSPNGETILKPSNKQQTILDMFKRSTRK